MPEAIKSKGAVASSLSKMLGFLIGVLVDILVMLLIPGSSLIEIIVAAAVGLLSYFITTRGVE